MVSEKMGLPFYRPVTLIFGKMAFFDNLLWKNCEFDFHRELLLCKFS